MVPLIRRKARPTQNQAMASRNTRWPMGSFGSSTFLPGALPFSLRASLPTDSCMASAFTFHRHRPLDQRVFRTVSIFPVMRVAVALADFQLHEIGGIHGLAQGRERNIAERIRAKELANFFRRVRGSDELFARGRVHAVVTGRNRGRAADAHGHFAGAGVRTHGGVLAL